MVVEERWDGVANGAATWGDNGRLSDSKNKPSSRLSMRSMSYGRLTLFIEG